MSKNKKIFLDMLLISCVVFSSRTVLTMEQVAEQRPSNYNKKFWEAVMQNNLHRVKKGIEL
jgi:hypothetical protein